MSVRASRGQKRVPVGGETHTIELAQREHPGNPKKQVAVFLERAAIKAAFGRLRAPSERTMDGFGRCLVQVVDDLEEVNIRLRNMTDIRGVHIRSLLQVWIGRGYSSGHIQTRLSHLRKFMTLIGKPDVIPRYKKGDERLAGWNIDPKSLKRSHIATESKAWTHKGLDPRKAIEVVKGMDELVACQLAMAYAFGMRVLECWRIDPVYSDNKVHFYIENGAKGGKQRSIELGPSEERKQFQREVIDWACRLAMRHPERLLARVGDSLEQTRRRFYYVMDKVGLNKKELGVTAHGLRHEYAAEIFEEITGMRPPVERHESVAGLESNIEKAKGAYLDISRRTGHSRINITSAYLGSLSQEIINGHKILSANVGAFQDSPKLREVFKAERVADAWLTGKGGLGVKMEDADQFELSIRFQGEDDPFGRTRRIQEVLNGEVKRKTVASPWVHFEDPVGVLLLMGS